MLNGNDYVGEGEFEVTIVDDDRKLNKVATGDAHSITLPECSWHVHSRNGNRSLNNSISMV